LIPNNISNWFYTSKEIFTCIFQTKRRIGWIRKLVFTLVIIRNVEALK